MNLHPLTPRKPGLPAAIVSALAFGAIFVLGIVIHFVVFPPSAWLPAADEAPARRPCPRPATRAAGTTRMPALGQLRAGSCFCRWG